MIAITHFVAPLALVAAIAGGLYLASHERPSTTTIVIVPLTAPAPATIVRPMPVYCGYYWPCWRD